MGAGLDRAGVLTEGQEHGVDAVHDPLVVGGGPVGIALGEDRRLDDAAGEGASRLRIRRSEALHRHPPRGVNGAEIGEIREDPEVHPATAERFDPRGEPLAHRVDGVGAHRVLNVHEDFDDPHVADGVALAEARDEAHREVPRAPTRGHEARMRLVREREQSVLLFGDRALEVLAALDLQDLDLPDHVGGADRGDDPVAISKELGGVTRRGHDRRLLGGHRDQAIATIDPEVGADPEGEAEDADGVLDHEIRLGHAEAALGIEGLGFGFREPGELGESSDPFSQRQAVEAW